MSKAIQVFDGDGVDRPKHCTVCNGTGHLNREHEYDKHPVTGMPIKDRAYVTRCLVCRGTGRIIKLEDADEE